MPSFDVDLCVLGAGSAGVRLARRAAGYGARVLVVAEGPIGGTCVHAGCIPKKLLVYGSRFARAFEDARGYGWNLPGPPRLDWPALVAAKDRETARLGEVYASTLAEAGVEVVQARGVVLDANRVEAGGRIVSTRHLAIATGGHSVVPQIPGVEHAITSHEALGLARLPERLVVVGSGYIALELACIFHALGARTTIVHRGNRLLREFDAEASAFLAEELVRSGIAVRFGLEVRAIEARETGLLARLSDGSELATDELLFATGRRPSTAGFGLEQAGIALREDGAVVVDAFGETSVPGVYALGDVTGGECLTPVATAEGEAVARTLFGGGGPVARDHEHVSTCVFSQPAVARVGLSEEDARARYANVRVFRSRFRPLEHALSGRAERAFVKLVVDAASDRVLGCHAVGTEAGEIVQGFAVALRCGVTKAVLDATIGVHPTVAEEILTLRSPVT